MPGFLKGISDSSQGVVWDDREWECRTKGDAYGPEEMKSVWKGRSKSARGAFWKRMSVSMSIVT